MFSFLLRNSWGHVHYLYQTTYNHVDYLSYFLILVATRINHTDLKKKYLGDILQSLIIVLIFTYTSLVFYRVFSFSIWQYSKTFSYLFKIPCVLSKTGKLTPLSDEAVGEKELSWSLLHGRQVAVTRDSNSIFLTLFPYTGFMPSLCSLVLEGKTKTESSGDLWVCCHAVLSHSVVSNSL